MAQKSFCDVCGKETKEEAISLYDLEKTERSGYEGAELDLCPAHKSQLKNLIQGFVKVKIEW